MAKRNGLLGLTPTEERFMPQRQLDREIESLERDYENGFISINELNRSIRELERDYAEAARERAQEAYENELDRW